MNENYFAEMFARQKKMAKTGFYYAYDMIEAGLHAALGDDAGWLPSYEKIVAWLKDNKGRGLLVTGDAGLGKSLLCRDIIPCILREAKRSCAVVRAYELAVNGEWPKDTDFLVIDDIGVEEVYSRYGMKRDIFREVVDEAERSKQCLIVTTNLTLVMLTARYGDRTIDRLQNITSAMEMRGESLRNHGGRRYPFPVLHRAYGLNFDSEEMADAFAERQACLRNRYDMGELLLCEDDRREYEEGQPMVEKDGYLCAMFK